jgi:hypothetical protein
MRSLFDELFSSALSSTSDTASSDNIFFSYNVMGLVFGRFHKSLLLVYMYTKSTQFDVNKFRSLLWTNEYKFWFYLHDDVNKLVAKCDKQWVQMWVHQLQ